jgi:hypothetical protein
VAAALYQLWSGTGEEGGTRDSGGRDSCHGQGLVSGGRKTSHPTISSRDDPRVADGPNPIGKIDVREVYCLVEVPAEDAEEVARRMNGLTIRRHRVTARGSGQVQA